LEKCVERTVVVSMEILKQRPVVLASVQGRSRPDGLETVADSNRAGGSPAQNALPATIRTLA
jgi:hypothetical protein